MELAEDAQHRPVSQTAIIKVGNPLALPEDAKGSTPPGWAFAARRGRKPTFAPSAIKLRGLTDRFANMPRTPQIQAGQGARPFLPVQS